MNEIFKSNRKQNKELTNSLHDDYCLACGRRGCDPCHIKSKGSGGGDFDWNLLSLCRNHHIEQHKIGWFKFCQKYPKVEKQLISQGWIFQNVFGVVRLVQNNQD